MNFDYRIKKFGYTFFMRISKTQTLEGITSLLPNGLHNPLFDTDNCSLEKTEFELGKVQVSYGLPDIYLTSDFDRSFRGWCFAEVKLTDYLRMQLDLIDAGVLDYNFFYWTVQLGKGTLRLSEKMNRPLQRIVSVLRSFSVPISDLGSRERVIYDTSVDKNTFRIFLGEKGRVSYG
jgi:hypothetical protein